MYQDKNCPKCHKKVRTTRCEGCKGTGCSATTQCRNGCNRNGWPCPTHGKNY